jgi:Protein of unknown function (DUF1064)
MKRFGKYRAVKSQCKTGHTHDSKREAMRCNELHILQSAGEITDLMIHPQYWFVINGRQLKHPNGRRVGYKSDFEYVENGMLVTEDVKGVVVRDWPLRRAVFKALFPNHDLRETK